MTPYEQVVQRSSGQCEAMVGIDVRSLCSKDAEYVFTRCGKRPIEVHHKVTRSRGGHILDKAGETYHLMALCHEHHMHAHDQAHAFENGLLIAGLVSSGPRYVGPDEYLSEAYGDH